MSTPEILVTIDAEGNVTVATKGYKGKACLEASRFVEETLGDVARLTQPPESHAAAISISNKASR